MPRMLLVVLLGLGLTTTVHAQSTKIVGIGAASCAHFNAEVAARPATERDYLAWAQGLMSGVLIRAPKDVDQDLDLAPSSMPLNAQADFLRTFCAKNPRQDYLDAVRALYHRLRGPGS